jgi:hypothetical protein
VVAVRPSDSLRVSQFIPDQKPGNVAVCLSGGGSRALTAGMGQLSALLSMQYAPQESLLSQVKALSTVSGGSWIGVPFTYLPSYVSEIEYLGGPYIQPGNLTPLSLGWLPPLCMAANITSDFMLIDILIQGLTMHGEGVPTNMLWQTVIGLHLLAPYGLFAYTPGTYAPDSFFSYDETTWNAIVSANPSLAEERVNLVTSQSRPYLICNTAMFVTANEQTRLAPVQATSFMTGIVSMPPGATDVNGFDVGGGGVTSFAFSSAPTGFDPLTSNVTVTQQRQWALVDIVGASSATFAAELEKLATVFVNDPERLIQGLQERGPAAANFLLRKGVRLSAGSAVWQTALEAAAKGDRSYILKAASVLRDLIPAYQYWSAANPPTGSTIGTTRFADGGNLEQSGVAAILAYEDIDNIIAFTNTVQAIKLDASGVVVVDPSIPPLFGYQPYASDAGYVPYEGSSNPGDPLLQNNQVFASSEFQPLLDNLWSASGERLLSELARLLAVTYDHGEPLVRGDGWQTG